MDAVLNPVSTPTDVSTDELNVEGPAPVSEETYDAWEPETNCGDGGQNRMLNSEISVQTVLSERPAGTSPLSYRSLPQDQKQILAEVLAVGGYATCDPSAPFQSLLKTEVKQEGDEASVYLEYDSDFYRLYIRNEDVVYTY